MSLDHELLNEVYLRDPEALDAIFGANQKPLVVLLVDHRGRVTYANDATYDTIAVGSRITRQKVSLEVAEQSFLANLVGSARASERPIPGTLIVSGEAWIALAATRAGSGWAGGGVFCRPSPPVARHCTE